MLRRVVGIGLVVGVWSAPVSGQTVETYQVRYYAPGATEPLQVGDVFPASAAVCNQADPGAGSSINPTRVVWDDPGVPGRVCVYVVPATGGLVSLPVGNYEGALVARNAAGAAESARVPFTRLGLPPAPSGVRFAR